MILKRQTDTSTFRRLCRSRYDTSLYPVLTAILSPADCFLAQGVCAVRTSTSVADLIRHRPPRSVCSPRNTSQLTTPTSTCCRPNTSSRVASLWLCELLQSGNTTHTTELPTCDAPIRSHGKLPSTLGFVCSVKPMFSLDHLRSPNKFLHRDPSFLRKKRTKKRNGTSHSDAFNLSSVYITLEHLNNQISVIIR